MAAAIAFVSDVDPARQGEFEAVYGPDGEWARLFRGAEGYLGTELHRSAEDAPTYLVVDRWTSTGAHAAFLDAHREEYDRRSRATAALYRRETPLGRFEAVAAAGWGVAGAANGGH